MNFSTALSRPAAMPTAPAATTVSTDVHSCRCGHVSDAHQHYRRGTDCALCGCGRFRGTGSLLSRVLRHDGSGAA